MNILYILGTDSNYDNKELRYSLRSIEKFGKNIDTVYLVGHNPGFLSDKVVYIPCEDKFKFIEKAKNILYKIVYAFDNSPLDECLVSCDDHIYIKATDFNNYPYYIKGNLPSNPIVYKENYIYEKLLYDTSKTLFNYECPTFNFAQHANWHCSYDDIVRARPIINESYFYTFGLESSSVILNAKYRDTPFKLTTREDVVLSTIDKNTNKILSNTEVFSLDTEISPKLKDFLDNMFPTKSIYEI